MNRDLMRLLPPVKIINHDSGLGEREQSVSAGIGDAEGMLDEAAPAAAAELISELDDVDVRIRQKAALAILDRTVGRPAPGLLRRVETTAPTLEQLLTQVMAEREDPDPMPRRFRS